MITAQEAKAIYDESGAEAEALMNKFDAPIRKAASEGKRHVFYDLGCNEAYKRLEATPLQKQVMDKLHALGYRVQFCKDGMEYVPRGLADDDGKGPLHYNYGFAIHW